jgi:threonine aldolase
MNVSLLLTVQLLVILLVCIEGLLLPQRMFGSALRTIDFRSDTVTRPTLDMRQAMFDAHLGDDVYQEDPTVSQLEEKIARMFGKEKALFFPSGTMANLAACMSWCGRRGSEAIVGDKSHLLIYEQGGISQLGGISTKSLPTEFDGSFDLDRVEQAIRKDNIHFPTTELIAIENTHNLCGGRVVPKIFMEDLAKIAKDHHIPIHLDGARIWHAAAATQIPIAKLVENVDSITACLSKGLGAPVGSMLIGSNSFIATARRIRKVLGGGLRQVGVLAAAGLVALADFEFGILDEDHDRTLKLAKGLAALDGLSVDLNSIDTNIVLVDITAGCSSDQFLGFLKERGVLALPHGDSRFRLVLHRDINDDDVDDTLLVFQEALEAFKMAPVEINFDSVQSTSSSLQQQQAAAQQTGDRDNMEPVESVCKTDLNFYEESRIYGMSVSPTGFCVFLQGAVCDRIVKVHIPPVDPLLEGLDVSEPTSSESLTLLQLMHGVDAATNFPRSTLASKFMNMESYILWRILINSLDDQHPRVFDALLLGCLYQPNTWSTQTFVDCNAGLQADSLDKNMLADDSIHQKSCQVDVQSLTAMLNQFTTITCRKSESNIAFETIALSLRHNTTIEVNSKLFNDSRLSYTVDELHDQFPSLLLNNRTTDSNEPDPTSVDFLQLLERTLRFFQEAERQQNKQKSQTAMDKINHHFSKLSTTLVNQKFSGTAYVDEIGT